MHIVRIIHLMFVRISYAIVICLDILRWKRVVLYGASTIGQDHYCQLRMEENIQIVAWVDKAADTLLLEGIDF